jgi:eukaryotic-like serine/threonine-protein kinase
MCPAVRTNDRRQRPKTNDHEAILHSRMFFRGQIIGKYKILATIGSGGFGTVYRAEDTWINKTVALKVPHKQGGDFGELLREPRLLASLNHPNIVTIMTAERQENVFFIVMELVPGETLEEIISRDGALDLARTLDYTCQICNAVDHAHRHGVLHRDLRPSNVLVSDGGRVKVADFGTSRFLEIAAHGTTIIGSPPYMAPEQFHGKAVFASDIYSLGVTMFQMLTGELPYDTRSAADPNRLKRGEMIVSPRLRNPKIPRAIETIVLKAMAPDTAARYQRAGDLLADLLAAHATTPRRPSSPTPGGEVAASEVQQDIQMRLKARETPQARFCWQCRKPLHARSDRCPFCGEAQ